MNSAQSFKQHAKQYGGNGRNCYCVLCGTVFWKVKEFVTHVPECEPEANFKGPLSKPSCRCDACNRDFLSMAALKNHKKSKHLPECKPQANFKGPSSKLSYRCDACNKEFSTMAALTNHKKWKHLKCDVCGKKFSKMKTLNKHKKKKHTENQCPGSDGKVEDYKPMPRK